MRFFNCLLAIVLLTLASVVTSASHKPLVHTVSTTVSTAVPTLELDQIAALDMAWQSCGALPHPCDRDRLVSTVTLPEIDHFNALDFVDLSDTVQIDLIINQRSEFRPDNLESELSSFKSTTALNVLDLALFGLALATYGVYRGRIKR